MPRHHRRLDRRARRARRAAPLATGAAPRLSAAPRSGRVAHLGHLGQRAEAPERRHRRAVHHGKHPQRRQRRLRLALVRQQSLLEPRECDGEPTSSAVPQPVATRRCARAMVPLPCSISALSGSSRSVISVMPPSTRARSSACARVEASTTDFASVGCSRSAGVVAPMGDRRPAQVERGVQRQRTCRISAAAASRASWSACTAAECRAATRMRRDRSSEASGTNAACTGGRGAPRPTIRRRRGAPSGRRARCPAPRSARGRATSRRTRARGAAAINPSWFDWYHRTARRRVQTTWHDAHRRPCTGFEARVSRARRVFGRVVVESPFLAGRAAGRARVRRRGCA